MIDGYGDSLSQQHLRVINFCDMYSRVPHESMIPVTFLGDTKINAFS